MKIGVIKEIKDRENRVALTPEGAGRLISEGHEILLETNAGVGSGFPDEVYARQGVKIVDTKTAWSADLVIKIKEPLEQEYKFFKDNFLFTYFHLAGVAPELTHALMKAGTTAIAYETVEDAWGRLPLLAPMSAIAGNMAASVGGYYLAKFKKGKGVQLGRVLGERHGKVMVIGSGTVGRHAIFTADGIGAKVFVFTRSQDKPESFMDMISDHVQFVPSTPENIGAHIRDTDLLIGAVLLVGARAPHVVSEAQVKTMEPGSVIVDVSIDQGGCIETSRPTSHSDPVYIKHGVTHYCVTNMPGAFPRTATLALTGVTLPYISQLASEGLQALKEDPGFAKGVNIYQGRVTLREVAEALGLMDAYQSFAS